MTTLTPIQLDALRELANVAAGNAGTALSELLGTTVEVAPMTGDRRTHRYGVLVPLTGGLDATVAVRLTAHDAVALCARYDLDPDAPGGRSLLGEVGNILGARYAQVLGALAGRAVETAPPRVVVDEPAPAPGHTVVLDSVLTIAGRACSVACALVPATEDDQLVSELLAGAGV